MRSQLAERRGDYRGALSWSRRYSSQLDSISRYENDHRVMTLEKRYNYARVEDERNALEAERQHSRVVQLLVAMDFLKPATVREGVKWLPEKQLDVFFVTLNKADKDYSPTTMYHDYSINENLFHWQSQSTTAADSPTGQRYIHHQKRGSKVLLFVREFKADRITGGAAAYTFLGTANYVKHDGSRPMNITWKLDRPIPAKFLKKTNKLVVG